jgi:hypothetical protein
MKLKILTPALHSFVAFGPFGIPVAPSRQNRQAHTKLGACCASIRITRGEKWLDPFVGLSVASVPHFAPVLMARLQ